MANRILVSRGTAPVKLATGKSIKVAATKDQAYQVVDLSAPPGNAPADPAKLAKEGSDLVVRYPDGTEFTLGDFFTVCAGNSCTVTLADGTATGQIITAGAVAAGDASGLGMWGWLAIIGGGLGLAAAAGGGGGSSGGGDTAAPGLSSSAPADNDTGVAVNNSIVLTFNETVKAGTGNFVLSNGTDTRTIPVSSAQVTFSGSTVTINPSADLLPNSTYNLQFSSGVIVDDAGNAFAGIASASTLNFSTPDTIAPTLSSSSPADGATAVLAGSNIVLTFSEAVQAGTGNIVISNGTDTRTISVTDTSQVAFSGNTVTINPALNLQENSNYNVQLVSGVVRDLGNNPFAGITTPTALNFQISDVSDPVLLSRSPADNATAVAVGANIVMTFSEAVKAGSGNIVISNGTDTRNISITDATQVTISGNTVTINPLAPLQHSSDYNVQMASGVILDLADRNFAGIFGSTNFNFSTQDLTAPVLVASSPADNASAVLLGSNIVLTFNEAVQAGTGSIVISNGVDTRTISITDATQVSINANVITINPAANLQPDSNYSVQMASGVIRDLAGNNHAGISSASVLNFTTEDTQAPTLVSSSPADNASGVAMGSNIVLTFSELIQAGTGSIVISNGTDTRTISVLDTSQITVAGSSVTINPAADLQPNATYSVQIANGAIRDLIGNNFAGITNATTLNFQTQDQNAPILSSRTPADDATNVLVGSNIVLTFSEAVQAGAGSIVISNGTDTRVIDVQDTSQVTFSGSTVTINPSVNLQGNSSYNLTMASGVIRDLSGNPFAGLFGSAAYNFDTQDLSTPTLLSSTPADNATAVVVGSNIVLTFSETVQAGTGNIVISNGTDTRTISVTDATQVTVSGSTVTINPTADLQGGSAYNVQMASGVIRDLAGNHYAGIANATDLNFTTQDLVAPTLVSSSPADDAISVPVAGNIVLTFSETVQAGSGNIVISNGAGDTRTINVTNAAQVTVSGNTVTINPTADLQAGNYSVQMAAGVIRDASGNHFAGITNATTLNFSTELKIDLSDVAAGVGGFVINGQGLGEWGGFAASAGDVNGDGLIDVIVGAPEFDPVAGADAGRSYVVFGKTGTTAVDLSAIAAGVGGFAINGQGVGDMSGQSVGNAGDINGDGLADLILGGEGNNSTNEAGRTWVVYGKTSGTAVNLSAVAAGVGGFRIAGDNAGDSSGVSVSGGGDINGDGYADLIIGADHADFLAGRAYVLFGSSTLASVNLSAMEAGVGGFAIRGMPTDQVGISVDSAGDVNGDGLTDVIVSGEDSDESGSVNSGRTYVVFGKTGSTAVELSDVAAGTGGFMIDGNQASQFLGYNVSGAGDVNGDGLADLLVGSGKAVPDTGGAAAVAQTYVVFGRTSGAAAQLSALQAGVGGFVINGQSAGDGSGTAVAGVGDLNGDGLADMLVGAAWGDTSSGMDAGRSYVVYGKSGATAVNLSAVALGSGGFAINGQSAGDFSGGVVAGAGDVNGDGLADLLVSAVGAMGDAVIPGDFISRVYVLFGSTSGAFAQTAVDQYGTAGADAFTDGGIAQTLVTGAGNDTLTATAASVLYGGAGNDTLNINATMITALQSAMGAGGNITRLARIDGGTGIDTLALSGAGLTLDLTQIANQAASNPDGGSRIDSIERINLTGSGNNALILDAADVRDMAGLNLYNNGNGWSGLGASVQKHQMVVDGNAGDSITVTGLWSLEASVTNGGQTYRVYNNEASAAQLLVDSDITASISLYVPLSAIAAGNGGFAINGLSANEASSWSTTSAGDVNGDGLIDLIVGAPVSDPAAGADAGRSYVVFGKTGNQAINLSAVAAGTGGFVINGESAGDFAGTGVASAGDVNGDGLADLLIGAEAASPDGSTQLAGKTYVVFGKTGTTAVNLSAVASGAGGFVINGASASDFSGKNPVGVGDVNADGLADLLIGTLGDGPDDLGPEGNSARGYLVFGKSSGAAVDLTDVETGVGGFVINGPVGRPDGDGFWASSVGDFNGDGLADMGFGLDVNQAGTDFGVWIAYGRSGTTAIALSDVAAGVGGFAIRGDSGANAVGYVSAAGDVNGDGFADAVLVSRDASVGSGSTGRVSVIFGSAGAASIHVTDIGQSAAGFVINGQEADDYLGTAMSAGDLNGDGLADLLISAPTGNTIGGERAGKTYVVFGKTGNAAINLSAVVMGSGGFVIHGEAADDYSGIEVDVAGDINGDGLADLVVSGGGVDTGLVDAGRTYVIFGGTSGVFAQTKVDQYGTAAADTFTDGGTAQTLVTGAGNDTLTATAASILYAGAGNDALNINATMITALQSKFGLGGNTAQLARIDGGTGTDTLALSGSGLTLNLTQIANQAAGSPDGGSRIDGVERIDLTGTGNNSLILSPADIRDMAGMNLYNNGNGWTGLGATVQRHQLVVDGNAGDSVTMSGAWTQAANVSNGGQTYRVYNDNDSATQLLVDSDITISIYLPTSIELSAVAAGSGGFVINGQEAGEEVYQAASAGDVNGDGLMDVIVGAPSGSPAGLLQAGRSYVVFGKTGTTAVNLSAVAAGVGGFVINGQQTDTFSGAGVSGAGDVNGDGLADLLVGGEGYDIDASRTYAGRAYVIYGKTSGTAVNLSAVANGSGGFRIDGASAGHASAEVVRAAGDINGDGYGDLLFGTDYEGTTPHNYVVFGSSSSSAVELSAVETGVGGFAIRGAAQDFGYGSMDGVGDVNGDGLADVLVTAMVSNASGFTAGGRAYVVFGKTSSTAVQLSAVVAGNGGLVINGLSNSNLLGSIVSGAGDVNGDGLADFIVGTGEGDPGEVGASLTGHSYVVFGRTAAGEIQLTNIAAGAGGFVINGQCLGDASGLAVAGVGDLNGDGLADLLVGSRLADTAAGIDAGRSYVVYGKSVTTAVNLSAVARGSGGFAINGQSAGDLSGNHVSGAGDVNGDGLADLLVTAVGANPGPGVFTGRSYVLFGSTSGAFSQTAVDQYGTAGADTFTDGGTAQTLVTGAGNDTLTATAASVLYAGAGNDTLNINATMISALQSAMGAGGNVNQLARIDGGTGIDTLALSDANLTLNLTQIANQAASNPDGGSRIDSIERVDLTGTGNNTLVLQLRDVLDMGSANTFVTNGRQQLLVTGNSGDRLDFADGSGTTGWTQSGTASIDSVTYNVWNHNTAFATVYVNTTLTVI